MTIPRDFIQELLTRVDIVDLIDERVPLRKKSSHNYFACCPFHTEKSASFSVAQNKQFYHCFGCGAHGNAIDFLMQFDRLSFRESIETLAHRAGMIIPEESKSHKPAVDQDLYKLLDNAAKFYQNALKNSKVAIEYLKKRGLSGHIAKTFGLGFAPPGWDNLLQAFPNQKQSLFETGMLIKKDEGGFYDRFRERILFPIHDRRGRVIGFGGRILDQGEPKYLNSPETPIFQKGQELYGLYQALEVHRQLPRALIVEGYMDVIALFQHGVDYAVATLGTATTAHHLQRLYKVTTEIVFCFDGDQAGRLAAWRALLVALPVMREEIPIRFMFLPENEDPDSLIRKEGKEAFTRRIENASSFSQYFFQSLSTQTDMSSMDGRARFVKLATEYLNQLPAGIFQQMMMEELAKKARIDIAQIQTPTAAKKPIVKPQKARSPSALRLAMSLLVQEPSLATLVHEPLPALEIPGFSLFIQLIEAIQTHSIPHLAALREYWREKEESPVLEKLANIQHMIPADGIKNEFLGAIAQLKKLAHAQIIENMLAKAARGELSLAEKEYLNELIHTK